MPESKTDYRAKNENPPRGIKQVDRKLDKDGQRDPFPIHGREVIFKVAEPRVAQRPDQTGDGEQVDKNE